MPRSFSRPFGRVVRVRVLVSVNITVLLAAAALRPVRHSPSIEIHVHRPVPGRLLGSREEHGRNSISAAEEAFGSFALGLGHVFVTQRQGAAANTEEAARAVAALVGDRDVCRGGLADAGAVVPRALIVAPGGALALGTQAALWGAAPPESNTALVVCLTLSVSWQKTAEK